MKNHFLRISVIIPVHNGGASFRRCLASLADAAPAPAEIIVVADGDTEGSAQLAEEFGAKVFRTPEAGGPARARNLGAREAEGDILFFIDADVNVAVGAIAQIADSFRNDPELAALIGSYDDMPAAANFLSQYKNLFHHYVHQTGNTEASTFWGACGAIRREFFLELNGFDESYREPCIEDIELGYRLKQAGYRIRLCKELQVKHLKRWGIKALLKTDFFQRALPWTELILRQRRFLNDLNLKMSSRASVMLTYGIVVALAGAWWRPGFLAIAIALMLLLLFLNASVYRFFQRKRGFWFALRTVPWHWLYFFYSGLAFAIAAAGHFFTRPAKSLVAPIFMKKYAGVSSHV
jgi:glycosyltransferase involved in cell wall biosynthesis